MLPVKETLGTSGCSVRAAPTARTDTRDDVDDAGREQVGDGLDGLEDGQGGHRRRCGDHGIAGDEGAGQLDVQEADRPVPGRDGAGHTPRHLLDDHPAELVVLDDERGHGVSGGIDAEPEDVLGEADVHPRLPQRLAHLFSVRISATSSPRPTMRSAASASRATRSSSGVSRQAGKALPAAATAASMSCSVPAARVPTICDGRAGLRTSSRWPEPLSRHAPSMNSSASIQPPNDLLTGWIIGDCSVGDQSHGQALQRPHRVVEVPDRLTGDVDAPDLVHQARSTAVTSARARL